MKANVRKPHIQSSYILCDQNTRSRKHVCKSSYASTLVSGDSRESLSVSLIREIHCELLSPQEDTSNIGEFQRVESHVLTKIIRYSRGHVLGGSFSYYVVEAVRAYRSFSVSFGFQLLLLIFLCSPG